MILGPLPEGGGAAGAGEPLPSISTTPMKHVYLEAMNGTNNDGHGLSKRRGGYAEIREGDHCTGNWYQVDSFGCGSTCYHFAPAKSAWLHSFDNNLYASGSMYYNADCTGEATTVYGDKLAIHDCNQNPSIASKGLWHSAHLYYDC